MLADIWPPFAISIRTPRLTLRLPCETELVQLAELAADGVHREDERPFLTPWAEQPPDERARCVVRDHWSSLASWSPTNWCLGLGAFLSSSGLPLGLVTVRSRDFAVRREVTTSSWLGLQHQRQGFGTEARLGLLTMAFDHLGATDATTEVFRDNHASQGVSRKLGYEPDGISRDARDGEVVVSDRLRLTLERWTSLERPSIAVTGMDEARSLFG